MKMASADSVIMEINMGRVLNQIFREEGISGRARSDRLVMRGPSFDEGAAINVRRCDRRGRNTMNEGVQVLGKSRGSMLIVLSHRLRVEWERVKSWD